MVDEFAAVAAEHFGIEAVARVLPGEIDTNVRLDTAEGKTFVLRLSPPETDLLALDFQSLVLQTLERVPDVRVPVQLPSRHGAPVVTFPDGRVGRLFTWVPGTSFARCGRPPAAAGSVGHVAGAVVNALADLDHPGAHRELAWDLRHAATAIEERSPAITDPHRRRILDTVAARTGRLRLEQLPMQVIHNDLNDENVLFENGRVNGIIDVGDAMHSIRIGEVAIAAAYTMLDQDDPVSVGAEVIQSFAAAVPVTEAEARAIFDLILARLAISVAISAHRGGANPHHIISEPMAWDLLERLMAGDGARISAEWLAAAGHPRSPSSHRAELLAERRRRLGPSLSLSYREPLHIVRGQGSHLYDDRARRYVDAVNNVAHVGHSHPQVVRAAAEQMARLNTNTRYLHREVLDYASRLAATLPGPLEVVYLVNSGSEANELAIRLVRAATGAFDLACLDHGYHGHTTTLVDVSPYKFNGPGGEGQRDWVAVLPAPDPYRNERFRGHSAADRYRVEADTVLAARRRPVAGLIAEALPGCAGQVVPDPGVIAAAYAAVRAHGGLVIADEVQTGFGRVGSAFWAFELHGVIPDVVTMGKPIGNGHPLGAVVTTRAVAAAFDSGMEYFNTFGGNPVSAAVGSAVLDVIEGEGLQEHADGMGAELIATLSGLGTTYPQVGDVRGAGLFLGVELVSDPVSRRPATALARQIVEHAKSDGVLLSRDGPAHNVIKIKPPMVFSDDDAARLVTAIAHGLEVETR